MTTQPPFPSAPGLTNPLDSLLGYQLRRASAFILADLGRSLADLGLRPAEASVLLLIAANPGITQSDIGRILGIQRANMTPMTATLTEAGLIDRAAVDGRSHALRLSASGEFIAEQLRERIIVHEARFLPQLPEQRRVELVNLLRDLWKN